LRKFLKSQEEEKNRGFRAPSRAKHSMQKPNQLVDIKADMSLAVVDKVVFRLRTIMLLVEASTD